MTGESREPMATPSDFYMENYKKAALESAPLKSHCWFHYIDNNFIIWLHGPDKLKDFLHHHGNRK
jgi:hypothetical protein